MKIVWLLVAECHCVPPLVISTSANCVTAARKHQFCASVASARPYRVVTLAAAMVATHVSFWLVSRVDLYEHNRIHVNPPGGVILNLCSSARPPDGMCATDLKMVA